MTQSKRTNEPVDAEKKALESNRAAFKKLLPGLLKAHKGKYALVNDGEFVDAYDTMEAAYTAAVDAFDKPGFFIGKVVEKEEPESLPALQHGLIHVNL